MLSDEHSREMQAELFCDIIDNNINSKELVGRFNSCIDYAIKGIFKQKTNRGKHNTFPINEWCDEECKEHKSRLRHLSKYPLGTSEYDKFWTLKKQYRALTQKKKRKYQANVANQVEKMSLKNPTEYWNFWKKNNLKYHPTDRLNAEIFRDHYMTKDLSGTCGHDQSLMQKVTEFIDSDNNVFDIMSNEVLWDILNAPINEEELCKALGKLKNNKSSGIDGIPSEFYKYGGKTMKRLLIALYNRIFDSGDYPALWCEGTISPLHKAECKLDPENYRKITVIPAIGKIFESIINNRIVFAKEALQMEDPFQNGFKFRARATDNAFMLNSLIDICNARKHPLYVCYIDFKSAFDRVVRSALMYKLYSRGVRGKYFKILKSMYSKSKCRVKYNSRLSEIFDNLKGVLQGGVISPTLFKIFLDDLGEYLDKSRGIKVSDLSICHMLFADDLILVSETAFGLQKLITGLEKFCEHWQMEVNLRKTKICVFNKKFCYKRRACKLYYQNKEIEEVESYNVLGITFYSGARRFQSNYNRLQEKATRAIFSAKQLAYNKMGNQTPFSVLFKIFDTQIQPIIDYGCEVWYQGKPITELENLYKNFIKRTLGLKRQTSNLAVYGETGRYPLEIRQIELFLKYWLRIISLDNSDPLFKIYKELLKLYKLKHKNWVGTLSGVLEKIDHAELLERELPLKQNDVDTIASTLKTTIQSRYQAHWVNEINDNSKNPILRTYKLFKLSHHMENYISCKLDNKYKKAIAQFRVSSHKLGIETGRHEKPIIPLNCRICKYCQQDSIDDEQHFLVDCHFHDEDRYTLLEVMSNYINDIDGKNSREKFILIMKCKEIPALNALGKYIHNGFQKRKSC